MFTGKFSFGTRKECQAAVIDRGGYAPSRKSVSSETDYLVIGAEGSKDWKRGSYGNKIEAGILSRREHGIPAIISEEHWVSQIGEV
jgi:NAD-dependent DNA ligase